MRTSEPPVILPAPGIADYTKVTFVPDLARFGMAGESSNPGTGHAYNDALALLKTRVVDMAGCLPSVKVSLNGQVLPIAGFQQYINLYAQDEDEFGGEEEFEEGQDRPPVSAFTKVNERWEVGVRLSHSGQLEHISFVNNMATPRGGTHVNLVTTALINRVTDVIRKRHQTLNITPAMVRSHLFLFVNALIENPSFDSQSKEMLTSHPQTFGSTCVLPEDFIKEVIATSGIVDAVIAAALAKENRLASRAVPQGSRKRILSIPKLEDALNAGGPMSKDCTLILTEGDSAKALAVAGLEVVGRELYGVFPLRGKFINVRDANMRQLKANQELINLCMILGLDLSTDLSFEEQKNKLRYGHVMIMTDQDHDGVHIKGLLLNFFHFFWPDLLRTDGSTFLEEFTTPLIKAFRGKEVLSFYSQKEYDQWRHERVASGDLGRWKIKYYKGLGTSTSAEGRQYFEDLEFHRKILKWKSEVDCECIDLAFNKNKTEDRKQWIINYLAPKEEEDMDPTSSSNHELSQEVVVRDFINKELVQFSYADLVRSIPSVVDGLKPSQRKVLYACFKRRLHNEIKVAQLAGYCAEHTAYHHGEQSLYSTIINMAQDFVGSNNLPLLVPCGQFGTRLQGGKDAASPRYIFTQLASATRKLFPEVDDQLLKYKEDDGLKVEPETFVPVLPLLLVNGSQGIGTGWSTYLPPHNPLHVADAVEKLIRGLPVDADDIQPWVKGFKGGIERKKSGQYVSTGVVRTLSPRTVEVAELPLGKWTADYKEFLAKLLEEGKIRGFQELHTTHSVRFLVTFTRENLLWAEAVGVDKYLKLESSIAVSNMHAFSTEGVIKRYSTPIDVLEDFMPVRSRLYGERRKKLEEGFQDEVGVLNNKARFVEEVSSKAIDLFSSRPTKNMLIELLHRRGYQPRKDKDDESITAGKEFDYLLSIPMYNFTEEVHSRLKSDVAKAQGKL